MKKITRTINVTRVSAKVYEIATDEVTEIEFSVPGIMNGEKAFDVYSDGTEKLIYVTKIETVGEVYEMDIETFMKYATKTKDADTVTRNRKNTEEE